MKKIVALLLALMLGLSCAVPAFASEAVVTGYTGSDTELAVPSSLGGHTVTEIGTAAFYRSKIEKLSIPSTVRKIGWWAFYGSSRLSEVKLVRGLGTISFGAFLNCTSLREIELPPTVYSIGSDAFAVNCRTRTGIPDILNDRRVGEQYYCVNTSFVIKGCIGTAAEKYAADKKLVFSGSDTLTFGDVNSDGSINSKDIILVENYINGGRLSTPEKFNSDLDCDGSVGESDLELLRSYISGKISLYDIPANSFRMPEHSEGHRHRHLRQGLPLLLLLPRREVLDGLHYQRGRRHYSCQNQGKSAQLGHKYSGACAHYARGLRRYSARRRFQ